MKNNSQVFKRQGQKSFLPAACSSDMTNKSPLRHQSPGVNSKTHTMDLNRHGNHRSACKHSNKFHYSKTASLRCWSLSPKRTWANIWPLFLIIEVYFVVEFRNSLLSVALGVDHFVTLQNELFDSSLMLMFSLFFNFLSSKKVSDVTSRSRVLWLWGCRRVAKCNRCFINKIELNQFTDVRHELKDVKP